MNSFTFHNPVRLHFGIDILEKANEEFQKYGEKVLVVYGGGSIKRNGVYNDVIDALKRADKQIFELSGVEPNPRIETAREGATICKRENIDLVLAVGGGSVIDCAKLIVAAAKYDGDAWDLVKKTAKPEAALPLGVVLTHAATASEMNSGSVITNLETNEKLGWGSPHVFPAFSLLNPSYTLSVPKEHTVYGIVDMMSHIIEQYFHNATNTPVTDRMCEGVLQAIIEAGLKLSENLQDVQLRETIMFAGTIALNGFLQMGVRGDWGTHNIEHAISAVYDIPHAGGLAIIQPHWMRYALSENPDRFAQFAERVFHVERAGRTVEEVGEEGIQRLSKFWSSLGAPSRLADYQIDDRHFEEIVEHTLFNGPFGQFKKLDREDVLHILRQAL